MNRFVRAATLCAAFAFVGTPAALAFPPACTVLKCDAARKESKMYSDQAAQMRNNQKEYYDPKTAEMIKAYQKAADECAVKAKDCSEGDSGGDGGGGADPAREALTKALTQSKALGDLMNKAGTKGIADAGKDMDKIRFESSGTKTKVSNLGRADATTDLDSEDEAADEDDKSQFVSASTKPKTAVASAPPPPSKTSLPANAPTTPTTPPPIGWTSGECVEYCQSAQDAIVAVGKVHDAAIRKLPPKIPVSGGMPCTHDRVVPPLVTTLNAVSTKFASAAPPANCAADLVQAAGFARQFTDKLQALEGLLAADAFWDGSSRAPDRDATPLTRGGELSRWWEVTIRTYTYESTTCLGTCFSLKSYEECVSGPSPRVAPSR